MSRAFNELERLLGNRALRAPEQLERYGKDESDLGAYPPEAVALVQSVEEAREVLRLAAADRIPVTPRGLGSGKTGGALPVQGGIVLSTERLTAIREIDDENLLAIVEPGVVTATLHEAVEAQGLFYPPDPASLDVCSIGGNVAENAGGPRAFKYGVTREYVLALDLALVGGRELQVGRPTVKSVTGLDLVSLITGSEGTLALITGVTLKLVPRPRGVVAFQACFADVLAASQAVTQLLRAGQRPRALELMDEQVVEQLRQQQRWSLPAGRAALLLVELDGAPETLEAQLINAAELCEALGAKEISVATDEAKRRQLWSMRRQISTMLGEQFRFRVAEDICVPRARIPEMLRRIDRLAGEHDFRVACYGHAGDGNLHVNVVYDDEARHEQLEPLLAAIFAQTLDLGGTLSGEHGIGLSKRRFVPLEQSEQSIALQRELKRAFDPDDLLNPGKLLP
jgi:glycolate oxidase